MDYLIIGCGLSGAVIARTLAERGKKVVIWERRNHIGGNMYDYRDSHGFLVQKYGPHTFHTNDKKLYEYMLQFETWHEQRLICGASWGGGSPLLRLTLRPLICFILKARRSV